MLNAIYPSLIATILSSCEILKSFMSSKQIRIFIIIIWKSLRSSAIVIRQENKIVALNDENEAMKLPLCEKEKFN